ncbi:hypothetical protein GF324_06355 [bacterium]|nr:hypothetical protein [bacterium]
MDTLHRTDKTRNLQALAAFATAVLWLAGGLYLFFAAAPAYAKSYEVEATISRSYAAVGDTLTYKVIVQGSSTSIPTPEVNIPAAFRVLVGPASSLNVQWINGRLTGSRSLTYVLMCTAAGEHTIPAPYVDSKGDVSRGKELSVTVETGGNSSGGSKGNTQSAAPPDRDRTAKPGQSSKELDPIFLDVHIKPRSVYLQEPAVVTYTLYFREDVRTYDVRKLSTTEGFWTEELEVKQPPDIFNRVINGANYRAAIIHKLLLFPTRTGELTIGPMELVCEVNQRRRGGRSSFFDDPFFGGFQTENREVRSNPTTIHVKTLPEEGRPDGFDDIVGNYSIKAEVDTDSLQTNESVTLKVRVSGSGNIGFLPEPDLTVPPDIEIYDPETKQVSRPTANHQTLHGYKEFTYLMIPRRPGQQRIKPIELSFFNPTINAYRTVSTEEIMLQVAPAAGWASAEEGTAGGAAREVRTLGRDIRWIHQSTRGLRKTGPPLYQQAAYPLAYLVPALIVVAALLARRRMDKLAGDVAGQRSRKAAKRALSALKAARDDLAANRIEEGYTALARGLVNYLADRTHNPAAELDRNRIEMVLTARNIPDERRAELHQLLERCNSARFTPDGLDANTLGDLIEQARSWIMAVDRTLET